MGSSPRLPRRGRRPAVAGAANVSSDVLTPGDPGPLFETLAQLALIAHPLLLADSNGDPFGPIGPYGVLFHHPADEEFRKQLSQTLHSRA